MQFKNLNCDKVQKLKLWYNSKTQIVIKLNSNCDETKKNSNCDKTKLKLWSN